jgi:hypothetical protein
MTTSQRIADQEWRPNLFIAGFAKCGTTELCDYLSQHQDIFLPYEKEPHTFWDLARFPGYFSGDHTGHKMRTRIFSLNDYYELFSRGKDYRYRVDGSVSYTFDSKFSHVLKSFSENAKVILLIRNQKQRMASLYFHSFAYHKENDFARWVHDYFIPYMDTSLYYDKIAAYYHEFGDNNLRIVETSNLGSEDVHRQLFEYLEVEPIKITITHKNTNLLGPADSGLYRQMILRLTPIRLATVRYSKRLGLRKQGVMTASAMSYLFRRSFKGTPSRNKNNYSEMFKLIPDTVSSVLEEDYRKSIDFAIQNRTLISPTC